MSWLKWLDHPLFNVVFFFIIRQLIKDWDLTQPDRLVSLRMVYLGSQLAIVGLSYWLIAVVRKKNDQTPLRYVQPGSSGWGQPDTDDTLVTTTFMEYDVAEIKKNIKQTMTGIAIVAFLHLQFKYVQPLVLQSILGFKTFFLAKESRIHIWGGKTTSGELRRPFRLEAPFGMVSESKQPKVDKGSIKKAERAKKKA
ncbi:inorganic phosphate transporter Pho88 [Radiomyces spectabilis]|uniref:inorganic phosphate transporter Pho88 n=1 Tax=Radiomyces spectabilis TaxID=64574 RepID=UPI00221F95A9|nr:inorganic phosphate transporter Pho88 [Radiomyces spectabilis]KAI8374504.1 inorganic phosphate transporter Pho88 [Radiomyces spectabilis]